MATDLLRLPLLRAFWFCIRSPETVLDNFLVGCQTIWSPASCYQNRQSLASWVSRSCAKSSFILIHTLLILRWNKSSGSKPGSTPTSALPVYSPRSSLPKKYHTSDSLSSSLAGSELELDTYTEIDIDVEKSAGLSSPPDYSPNHTSTSDRGHLRPPSPGSSWTCLDAKPSQQSLRTINSRDRMYISDTSPSARTRTPSPAPFSDVVVPPFHRPFTPPSVYPVTLPNAGTLSLDAIRVTVHTQSHSTDAL